jgi:hypothetical protein
VPTASKLEEQVLNLPLERRAELIRRLILSLEATESDPDAERLWEVEIERRLAGIDSGEAKLLDWRESVARARKSLKSRRSR